jgi:hypothetical protein
MWEGQPSWFGACSDKNGTPEGCAVCSTENEASGEWDSKIDEVAWQRYVTRLYRLTGEEVRTIAPQIRRERFAILWRDHCAKYGRHGKCDEIIPLDGFAIDAVLRLQGVVKWPCEPADTKTPYTILAPHSPRDAVYFNRGGGGIGKGVRFTGLASDTWGEVTHCGGSPFEVTGVWHYVMPGSGMFVNTGKTITFGNHNEAAIRFLHRKCKDSDRAAPECDTEIPLFVRAAFDEGYASIQFLHHCDLRGDICGHELVLTYSAGYKPCPVGVEYRTGWRADQKCDCSPSTSRRSWRGMCASCGVMSLPAGRSAAGSS